MAVVVSPACLLRGAVARVAGRTAGPGLGALERRAVISVRKPFLWLLRGVSLQGERGSLETHPLGWLWRQGRGW